MPVSDITNELIDQQPAVLRWCDGLYHWSGAWRYWKIFERRNWILGSLLLTDTDTGRFNYNFLLSLSDPIMQQPHNNYTQWKSSESQMKCNRRSETLWGCLWGLCVKTLQTLSAPNQRWGRLSQALITDWRKHQFTAVNPIFVHALMVMIK